MFTPDYKTLLIVGVLMASPASTFGRGTGADDSSAPRPSADVVHRAESEQRKLLHGSWTLIEKRIDGELQPLKQKPVTWTFAGDRVVWHGEKTWKFWCPINALSSPREINLVGEDGPALFQSVYDCTGDTLTVAFFLRSETSRPSSLDPSKTLRPSAAAHVLMVFRRNANADDSVSATDQGN